MKKNTVTVKQIEDLWKASEVAVATVFDKTTLLTCKTPHGFVLTESSSCVDPENYDIEIGFDICKERIINRLWELEGYVLQKKLAEESPCECAGEGEYSCKEEPDHDFGWALSMLRAGAGVRRRGWNGKGIFLCLQKPDRYSKMTQPYIYIDTTGLLTDNKEAPKGRVPWLASQTDLLSCDWEAMNIDEI